MAKSIYLRKAKLSDVDTLEKLIALSSRENNKEFYSKQEIEASIGKIWTVDIELIKDKTYWVCENEKGKLIGCGGWSKRKTFFGKNESQLSNNEVLVPGKDAAKIRAFFVHPDFTRQGIGKKLLNKCEHEATSEGFKSFELMATLSGEKFYSNYDYIAVKELDIDLGNGLKQKAISMTKKIT